MKNLMPLLVFALFSTSIYAQSRTLIGYDFATGNTDTIADVFMPDLTSDNTEFNSGDFDQSIAELPDELDLNNLFEQSDWTNRELVDINFDINDFPLRTSTKMFRMFQNSLVGICSGNMIGSRYVLSAGHCVTDNFENIIYNDIIFCPVYYNGMENGFFECHQAQKVYLFEGWQLGQEDFGIYELEEDIGQKTGWLSIGFDEDAAFKDDILHKYTYPNESIFDTLVSYNGDSLYHSFGFANIIMDNSIGSNHTKALPGESGSSLIHVVNNETYTSYAVGVWSTNMMHSRIRKEHFYPMEELITRQDISSTIDEELSFQWKLYPNPSTTHIQYSAENFVGQEATIRIYGWNGKLISTSNVGQQELIDVSNLVDGTYLIRIVIGDVEKTFKFLKAE